MVLSKIHRIRYNQHNQGMLHDTARSACLVSHSPLLQDARGLVSEPPLGLCARHMPRAVTSPQCPQLFAQEAPADPLQRGGPAPCQRCHAHGLPVTSRLARTAAHQRAQCHAVPGRNCSRVYARVAAVLRLVDRKTGRSCCRFVLDVRSCTSQLRLIQQSENRVKYPSRVRITG